MPKIKLYLQSEEVRPTMLERWYPPKAKAMFTEDYLKELDLLIKLKLSEGKIEEAEKLSAKLIEVAEGTHPQNNAVTIVSRLFNSVVGRLPSSPTAEQIRQIREGAVNEEHLRLLSLFHYVNAGITAVFSCLFVLYMLLGILMIVTPGAAAGAATASSVNGGWVCFFFGLIPLVFCSAYAALNVVAGRCLQKRKRRTLCLVVAGMNCLNVPIGTALGVSSFLVLSKQPVKNIFESRPKLLT